MITFVLPVSHVDVELAKLLVQRIKKLGGLHGRRALVVSSWRAQWDVEPVYKSLGAELHVLQTENEEGWPESCNHMFYETVKYLNGGESPYYFFEADNVPLSPGWDVAFDEEYEAVGKPYMGAINTTKYLNVLTGKKFSRGKHMVGTGVYPADFVSRCEAVHYLEHRPFDIHIEKEVVPFCHDTKLIAHRWGTVNYRREGGRIVMDDRKPGFDYAAPLPPEAVIVHGVKDASLFKLLDQEELTK